MNRFFQIIGVISLLCFSFIFTESTFNVALEMDELMNTIKEKKDEYKIEKIEGQIDGNHIVPGINGKIVNVKKSYYNMKKIGKFIPNLIIYDEEKLNNSLKNNLDKYIISGNKKKQMVSLLFKVNKDTDISKVEKILDNNNISGNFFVDYEYILNNKNNIKKLIDKNHIIGNLNGDIKDFSIVLIDSSLKNKIKQKNEYCYSENEDINYLKLCAIDGSYSIKPNIVALKEPYKTVKQNLISGSLILFNINKKLENELKTTINFIKSIGFSIENLDTHLREN